MRPYPALLVLLLASIFFQCKNDRPGTDSASVLSRGNQAEHLDRFEQEIQQFEMADQKKQPTQGAVLFVGSSTIRMWDSLARDFSPLPVINRGFGGSTIPEVMHYAGRIVYKYRPKVIVFYAGDNDLAEDTAPAVAFQNLKKFIGETEKNLPGTAVIFISAKPSIARWERWRQYQQFNGMVQQFAAARPNLHFVDISGTLLTPAGEPDAALFIKDGLHLNRAGYAGFTKKIKPLVEELYGGRTEQ